ncbi:MAG: DMT family transporter [Clostridiales bacterium]|jgi:drug/metabolite transporter (DMT)-like permease|nr:DMT family transporter [Clostridiales bacterium]
MKNAFMHIILAAALFATLEPVGKLISEDAPPALITAARFLLGGAVLLLPAAHAIKKEKLRITAKILLKTAALGVLAVCGAMVLLQQAVRMSASPAVVAIVFSANSVFSVLLARPILKEKIGKWHLAAFALCMCGILAGADLAGGVSAAPVLLAGLSAVVFSLYTVFGKKAMADIPGAVVTCFSFLFGGGALMLAQAALGVDVWRYINAGTAPSLLYLGIAVTGIGFWAYFKVLGQSSAFHASLVFFIKPILTPFAVWIINGLAPGANIFAALALVLAGSLIAAKRPMGRAGAASGGADQGGADQDRAEQCGADRGGAPMA